MPMYRSALGARRSALALALTQLRACMSGDLTDAAFQADRETGHGA